MLNCAMLGASQVHSNTNLTRSVQSTSLPLNVREGEGQYGMSMHHYTYMKRSYKWLLFNFIFLTKRL